MSYAPALNKAWEEVARIAGEKRLELRFLSDTYEIGTIQRRISSLSCNSTAKDYTSIILLHYLIKKLELGVLPSITGRWIDFMGLSGGEAYYPAFKKRTIGHLVRKFGDDPDELIVAAERFGGIRSALGDVGVVIYPLDNVAILIKMSKADEEFGPDATILFDSNIENIFCTEDIVVLTETVIHQL